MINNEKDKNYHVKRARPDMEWLYAIIKKIENNDNILNELNVVANNLNRINGDRLDIGYISNYGQTFKDSSAENITASVRYTSQVKFVIETAKKPVKYGELLSMMQQNNPLVSIEKIKGFLRQLLENEYILTEMRPPLINTSPFEYIISKLNHINSAKSIYIKLIKVKELIDKYNNSCIGYGEELYRNIIKYMESIEKCENYLQVDLRLSENQVTLSNVIAQEIEKIGKVLLRISSYELSHYYLTKYMEDFTEKYGNDREVSVLELLDENKGIGSPAGYRHPQGNKYIEGIPENLENKKFESYLLNKLMH